MSALVLAIIFLSFVSLGLPDAALGAAWPVMYPDLGAATGAAGSVSLVVTAGTIVSSLLSGPVIRRFSTGLVNLISTLLTGLALLGYAWSPSLPWLLIFAVPLGLGAGSVDAALNNYVALHYQAHHMNWLHSSGSGRDGTSGHSGQADRHDCQLAHRYGSGCYQLTLA